MKMTKARFVWQVIKENVWFLVVYFLLVVMIGSTLYFHNIPSEYYVDTLLFTFPIVVLTLCVRGIRLWHKHQALQVILSQSQIHHVTTLTVSTLLEQDYHQLFAKSQAQLRKLEESYEVKEKALLDYSVLWSHQIKTPLASLDLLTQMFPTQEKRQLKEEIFKIQQYLDMMLQFLRLQSIQQDFRFEEVNYQQLITPLIKKYAHFFIYKDLEVDLVNLDQKGLSDKKWLVFLIEQILSNAIKYTKAGRITIYSPENRPQEIRIKDTGQGILPEELPRVFERGYTGLNGRENEGSSGLGLYLCQEIADQLGITLKITSVIGEGTEVCVTLPTSMISE
ncbi:sensor histidine kinase [Enterococcus saccharolyticus]|uniref:sensor histidine kinase n=1 Tax=Enterococcus TaxID=1350 RepID=UPI00137A519D|nr:MULTISPECIES: sensor histidine kinase [Enterococcus]MCD5003380.1 sensor histidine kinase [Enterococcus saccharolyticus]